jgi:hypothetical protein
VHTVHSNVHDPKLPPPRERQLRPPIGGGGGVRYKYSTISRDQTLRCQEAKYIERWPNTTSAWAGWSRFDIPVDRYDGVHSQLICTSRTLGSPTCHQASQQENTYCTKYQKADRASTLVTLCSDVLMGRREIGSDALTGTSLRNHLHSYYLNNFEIIDQVVFLRKKLKSQNGAVLLFEITRGLFLELFLSRSCSCFFEADLARR